MYTRFLFEKEKCSSKNRMTLKRSKRTLPIYEDRLVRRGPFPRFGTQENGNESPAKPKFYIGFSPVHDPLFGNGAWTPLRTIHVWRMPY